MSPGNIGPNMRAARASKAITQAELGRRLGVSKMAVSLWERGKQTPSVARLIEIGVELGRTPDELLAGPSPSLDPALLVNALRNEDG